MGFFDQAFGGGGGPAGGPSLSGGGGLGGSPSAFTSPGMNPQLLQLLALIQQRQQQGQQPGGVGMQSGMMQPPGGPQLGGAGMGLGSLGGVMRPGMMGAPGGAPPMPMGMAAQPPGVGAGMQQNPMLQQLLANPQLLRQLLGGMGGQSGGM